MKIAYDDILERINSNPSIEEVSSKLFQLGHENEILSDNIFDLDFTPNRGDCLSVDGLLRDLSVFYDVEKKCEFFEGQIANLELDFKNNSIDACPKVSFLHIEISNDIKEYHSELKRYFNKFNLKKNNFFTDISNYISYETGQPTHCYDYKKIGDDIVFDELNGNYLFEDLMGNKINLAKKNFVFKSNQKIINLAGVIGSKSTSCSTETTSVLIECAYFNPESIIGKSLRYDINSEAAHKFERGVDFSSHDYVLRRFIKIILDHTNILKKEISIFKYKNRKNIEINYDKSTIEQILGLKISNNLCEDYLERLDFRINKNKLIVPMYRNDVTNQNDLAEEVARCIGYDQIPTKTISIPKISRQKKNLHEDLMKSFLIDSGFYEVINFPFMPKQSSDAIKVDNPLDSNKGYLRTNLKDSLIKNLIYNEKRQQDSIKLFEVSNVYNVQSDNYSSERSIGIIGSGRLGKNYLDFTKNISEKFFKTLLENYVIFENLVIETLSRDGLNSRSKLPIIYVEFNINEISKNILDYKKISTLPKDFSQYNPVSEFPSSTRDLSFSIKDFSKQPILEKTILNFESDILKKIYVFDYYKNDNQNEIKIGFRFIFQSKQQTITDNQVDTIMSRIIKSSLKIDSVSIPGLQE